MKKSRYEAALAAVELGQACLLGYLGKINHIEEKEKAGRKTGLFLFYSVLIPTALGFCVVRRTPATARFASHRFCFRFVPLTGKDSGSADRRADPGEGLV